MTMNFTVVLLLWLADKVVSVVVEKTLEKVLSDRKLTLKLTLWVVWFSLIWHLYTCPVQNYLPQHGNPERIWLYWQLHQGRSPIG